MKVTLRAFATPLVLGMALVFFSGSASWSCEEGCNNRPEQVQQEPLRVACSGGSCDNRPEQAQQEPLRVACGDGGCNNRPESSGIGGDDGVKETAPTANPTASPQDHKPVTTADGGRIKSLPGNPTTAPASGLLADCGNCN